MAVPIRKFQITTQRLHGGYREMVASFALDERDSAGSALTEGWDERAVREWDRVFVMTLPAKSLILMEVNITRLHCLLFAQDLSPGQFIHAREARLMMREDEPEMVPRTFLNRHPSRMYAVPTKRRKGSSE